MVDDDAVSPSAFLFATWDLLKTVYQYSAIIISHHRPRMWQWYIRRKATPYMAMHCSMWDCAGHYISRYYDRCTLASQRENPYHAGTHYSRPDSAIKGACTDPDFIIVACMLANNSVLTTFWVSAACHFRLSLLLHYNAHHCHLQGAYRQLSVL